MTTLNELANPALKITLRGQEYRVNPIDGFAKQLGEKATSENQYETYCKIAARCLAPAFTFEQVFGSEDVQGLTIAEVKLVIDIATKDVLAVEASAKNDGLVDAERGEEKAPRPPDQSQPTQLAT